MGDTKYTRMSEDGQKPSFFKTSGAKSDVKQMISDLARMASPRALRERKNDVDDQLRRHEGQTTDSNNRY